jgi:hypothetical protein
MKNLAILLLLFISSLSLTGKTAEQFAITETISN